MKAFLASSEMDVIVAHHASWMNSPVEHLLVVTDFSECSNRAIARALERGSVFQAQVTLLHVIEGGGARRADTLRRDQARALLAEPHRSWCPDAHRDVSVNVRHGKPYLEIVREAIELGSDAILLGFEGVCASPKCSARALNVVRFGDKPVMLVAQQPSGPYRRLVIDCDPSVGSQNALNVVRRLTPEAEIHPLHGPVAVSGSVGSPTSASDAAGDLTDRLLDCVRQHDADLLVLDADLILARAYGDPMCLLQKASVSRCCDLLLVRRS